MWQRFSLTAILIGLTIWLGYFANRADFPLIIGAYIAFFIFYLVINKINQSITYWIGVGIILRIMLVFSFPHFSDDIYRFLWDGLLSTHGYNPFDYLPEYYIQHKILPDYLTPELYNLLNSKEYYTIYPPVLQTIFALAAWLFPKSVYGAAVVMKVFLLMSEIGAILLIKKLLRKFQLPEKNILLYALNPLVIIEITGNLHFEGFMIFFLLLALWLMVKNSQINSIKELIPSALAISASIASKLLPFMFLPFLITKLSWKKSFIYFFTIGLILLILFVPLFNGLFFENFGASLNLYFRRFEFNASVFYIAKWIGYQLEGKNLVKTIGPILAIITFLSILLLVIIRREKDWKSLPESWLFAISIYLLLATTVHPWYVTLPLVLSIFTRWRYAIVWSGAAWLSYSHYWGGGFQERFGLIALEYALVLAAFVYDSRTLRSAQHPQTKN